MYNTPSGSDKSLLDQILRLVVVVVVVLLGVWLALRLIAGIVHLVVWLLTTAVVVGLILAALYFLVGGRRRD